MPFVFVRIVVSATTVSSNLSWTFSVDRAIGSCRSTEKRKSDPIRVAASQVIVCCGPLSVVRNAGSLGWQAITATAAKVI